MNLKTFYNVVRKTFPLTDKNVRGFDFIVLEAKKRDVYLNDLAYILATTYHETAATMQPIAEYGKGKGRKYGVKGKYGQVPYGRGYVQLTWDENYEKADKKIGLKGALLRNFDLALDPKIAVQILFVGMEEGWFTGKKLRDYIDTIDEPDELDRAEYEQARRVINGVDKKSLIAGYALVFERALKAGGYASTQPTKEKEVTHIVVDDPGVEPTPVPEKEYWFVVLIKAILNLLPR